MNSIPKRQSLSAAPPILVEVRRGTMIESVHRGAVAVIDADGAIVEAHGDIERAVYPRSAIKPLLALPIIETGAADKWQFSAAELAIACASHGGEPQHVATAGGILRRVGLSEADLECGAHPPSHVPSAHALIRAGEVPTPLHNNCSGKHAGMLATSRHLGEATRGYINEDHPAQRRAIAALAELCGVSFEGAARGVDGCGFPQIGIPVRALAHAMARFGAPAKLPPTRAAACMRLGQAMVAAPFMLAGTGRFCTRVTEIARGKALLKTGAEGVYMAAIPAKGLGIALKIDDGAARGAEVALANLLVRLADLDGGQRQALEEILMPPINNVAGRHVGQIAPAPTW
jgi:L-asparaginase II